jgi:hypothetical protein
MLPDSEGLHFHTCMSMRNFHVTVPCLVDGDILKHGPPGLCSAIGDHHS